MFSTASLTCFGFFCAFFNLSVSLLQQMTFCYGSHGSLRQLNLELDRFFAPLTIFRLAVFNLLTVSLLISSYLSECLGLCGACLLILQLAPLPGDGLHLPRALLRLGAPIPFIACKPLLAIDTTTTCISRKPIRTMLMQWTSVQCAGTENGGCGKPYVIIYLKL